MNVDWTKLTLDLKDEALVALDGFIAGEAADLQTFGRAIAEDLVRAAREQNEELIKELGHQLQVLAEIGRIRLVAASWDQVTKILLTIGRVAMKTLLAAVV